jgi:hypothetical protein
MEMPTRRFQLRMDVDPVLIPAARQFVTHALEGYLDDADLIASAAIAAHELLEDSVKYSRDSNAELSMLLEQVAPDMRQLTLRLRTSTNPCHTDRLRNSVSEIVGCADPVAMYVSLIRRHAHDPAVFGLGFARIHAEGRMELALDISVELVTITARATVAATSSVFVAR